ncbi:MAG: phosphonate C-P lyase system protein PhnH [Clostridium sp.]|uniref:phosphonate C-P lyase system protein PhnH n=1 Tax=Clostridium sp. TaxID=1506 RepID=UPI003D6D2C3B
MSLDLVHDTQEAYRKLLKCMSRPGSIESLYSLGEKIDFDISFYKGTLVNMYVLLDGEVTFNIVSKNKQVVTNFINQLTYAKATTLEEADFIFILNDADENSLGEAFKNAKLGTLIDPHKCATIIVEAQKLSTDERYILKGPGIEDLCHVDIITNGSFVIERKNKNIEYPLGVDTIFVDREAKIMCLPRTTTIFE